MYCLTHLAPSPPARPPKSPSKLSLNYFDNERSLRGGDSIIASGYSTLINHLQSILTSNKGRVLLSSPVTAVDYTPSGVTVSGARALLAAMTSTQLTC
jgi:energy-coupling factor transporter ATP-binding protein EcfA2